MRELETKAVKDTAACCETLGVFAINDVQSQRPALITDLEVAHESHFKGGERVAYVDVNRRLESPDADIAINCREPAIRGHAEPPRTFVGGRFLGEGG